MLKINECNIPPFVIINKMRISHLAKIPTVVRIFYLIKIIKLVIPTDGRISWMVKIHKIRNYYWQWNFLPLHIGATLNFFAHGLDATRFWWKEKVHGMILL